MQKACVKLRLLLARNCEKLWEMFGHLVWPLFQDWSKQKVQRKYFHTICFSSFGRNYCHCDWVTEVLKWDSKFGEIFAPNFFNKFNRDEVFLFLLKHIFKTKTFHLAVWKKLTADCSKFFKSGSHLPKKYILFTSMKSLYIWWKNSLFSS